MIMTKREAKEKGIEIPYICPFHECNPDQQAVTGSCPDCIWIEDPCGCSWDEECDKCSGEKPSEDKE